jgi:NADH:ubiquinone oxidoreductase subunit 3 (subunit A)
MKKQLLNWKYFCVGIMFVTFATMVVGLLKETKNATPIGFVGFVGFTIILLAITYVSGMVVRGIVSFLMGEEVAEALQKNKDREQERIMKSE